MWEFCICFLDELSARNFKESICKKIKENNGIVTLLFSNNFYKILIAIPTEKKLFFSNYLKEKISENILLNYKKEYILSRLNFNKNKKTNMKVFLKALICFDSDTDKEIIIENLHFEKTLIIKSFLEFKLKFLKRKWNELISLANDNAMYLVSEESFNELIKFLISNLEYRCYAVNVFSKKDCYFICDTHGKYINDFLIENNIIYDDDILLTTLIALNPEKIIVHCNNSFNDGVLKNLYEYFSNRVEISK